MAFFYIILLDMQADIYDTQDDCEASNESDIREKCLANAFIINTLHSPNTENERFCTFCTSIGNSDSSICVTLLRIWRTLFKIR